MRCIMRPSRAGGGGHSRCTWARSSARIFGRDREGGSWAAFCCFCRSAFSAAAIRIHHTTLVIASHIHPATRQAIRPIALAATRRTTRRIMRRMISSIIRNGGPGDATSAPAYGQPTYRSPPPIGHGEPAQGYNQPSYGPRRVIKSDLNTTVARSTSMQVRRTATRRRTPWPATERFTRVASVAADPSECSRGHEARS